LVIADGFLARQVPGDVGQVNQAVDAAIQADEDAEIGNRLDLAGEAVALLVCRGELLPRVRHALLHAAADAAAFLVDGEPHDFDFVADLHDLARVDVLVGPVHLGHVHEAFHAFLDLDERTVVGEVGDAAEDAGADRVTAGNAFPGIIAELLETQRDAVALAV